MSEAKQRAEQVMVKKEDVATPMMLRSDIDNETMHQEGELTLKTSPDANLQEDGAAGGNSAANTPEDEANAKEGSKTQTS